MEKRQVGIPEELLMKFARQFDELGGILVIDGVTSPDSVGIIHFLKTTDEKGNPTMVVPPFQHEIIKKNEPNK